MKKGWLKKIGFGICVFAAACIIGTTFAGIDKNNDTEKEPATETASVVAVVD